MLLSLIRNEYKKSLHPVYFYDQCILSIWLPCLICFYVQMFFVMRLCTNVHKLSTLKITLNTLLPSYLCKLFNRSGFYIFRDCLVDKIPSTTNYVYPRGLRCIHHLSNISIYTNYSIFDNR